MAIIWSIISPGLGHIYTHRIPTGFFLLVWWIAIAYVSGIFQAAQFTCMGLFNHAKAVIDPEWAMFYPSFYGFAAYDAYVNAAEYNHLFEKEQGAFFKKNYQDPNFKMPTEVEAEVYVTASFDHSLMLEIVISELEQKGIPKGADMRNPDECTTERASPV